MPHYTVDNNARKLLPVAIDEIARNEPGALYVEYPKAAASYDESFIPVTYAQFANAINGAAWLIEKNIGKGGDFRTLAYLGPSDLRYMILAMAGVKAGYKVCRKLGWGRKSNRCRYCGLLHSTVQQHTQTCSNCSNVIFF